MTSVTTSIKTTRKRSMAPKGVVVAHTPYGATSTRMSYGAPGVTVTRRSNVFSQSAGPLLGPAGEASKVSREAVESVKGQRGKEKRDMCDLNGRLAEYLEKVRILETTNKALYEQLEQLRKMKGITGARIKEEYEEELQEARDCLKEAKQQLAEAEAAKLDAIDKAETLEAEVADLKKTREDLLGQIEKLNNLISELEGENANLRRNIEHTQNERDMYKKDIDDVRNDNSRLRDDLKHARALQIEAENDRDALQEELDFIRLTTDEEIAELREFCQKLQDMTPKMESMYKSGVKEAMSELQQHYETMMANLRDEYDIKLQDKILSMQRDIPRDSPDSSVVKTENKRLKTENKDLKDRLRDIENEIQSMQATMRRDETDGLVKQENKTLKSQMSDSRRNLEALQAENDRLRDQLELLRRQKDEQAEDYEAEIRDLKERIAMLERELAEVRDNLELLNDSRSDLMLEIKCYQKLLEGEESKIRSTLEGHSNMQSQGGANLASIIAGGRSGGGGGGGSSQQSSNPVKAPVNPTDKQPEKGKKPAMSQSTGRIQVTRSSKCGINVSDLDQAGRFVCLENSLKKPFDLSGYKLTRRAPKNKVSTFVFPDNVVLQPGKKAKVLSFNNAEDYDDDVKLPVYDKNVFVGSKDDCKSWNVGNGEVVLEDRNGKQCADSRIRYEGA